MATDIILIEKREELKRKLAAGEYKTLVDVVLEWLEHLLRKITRRTEPLPLWVVTVVLYIVTQSITYAGILITGGWEEYRKFNELFGLGFDLGFIINISVSMLFIASLVIINQYINRLIGLWRDSILDATESEASLLKFDTWLTTACDRRLHLIVIIIPNLFMSPYAFYLTSNLMGTPIGYGLMSMTILIDLIAWTFLYQLYVLILFSLKLRQYDIKLFAPDPGSSEIISKLSGELGFLVYYVAVFVAIITLGSSATGLLAFTSEGITYLYILFLWFPIVLLFILSQTSLASIVRRAKWKTLNEVQVKIEKLRESKNFGTPKTMDAINKLMDFHDRVKATHNSAIDSNTILNFINSLLLPLIAFLLGNLDKVLLLFSKKP